MPGCGVRCNILFLTVLHVVIKTGITVNDDSEGFLHTNNEVQYISLHKEFSSASRIRMPVPTLVEDSSDLLRFDPPVLDFKERHLGMPHHEKVTLFNIDVNKTIHMSSISGSTVHFHSSFFDDKVLSPLSNTTFNVVFLGREEGAIESSLYIHTSEGSFRYQVRGASVGSPYRLRPLVGVRLPLNSTYSPLIHIYNPSPRPLQVVEVYSSGGDFDLELPSGGRDGPPHLWKIPPFHTKPVVKLRFQARAHKNHTAYVRLRVNHSEEVLVVPLEVQVGPRPGIYSHDDLLDFGLGGSCDQPRQLRLLLYNSGTKPVRIQSIVAKPASKALRIDFQPIKVPPDSRIPTRVAVLTFDWAAGADAGQAVGRIIVKGKQGQHKLMLPYMARPLHGCLTFNTSVAQFCSEGERAPRIFTVANTFRVPLAVLNVSLHRDAQPYFQIEQFVPRVFAPGESGILFHLSLTKSVSMMDLKLETNLWLHTNVSRVFVQLLCYNGRLDLVRGSRMDMGLVGSGRSTLRHIAVVNRNPVAVSLLNWGTNVTWANLQLLGVSRGNVSLVLQLRAFHNLTNTTILPPGHYAVLAVSVVAPPQEGLLHGILYLMTQFERLEVLAKMQVARGALQVLPDPVRLSNCFPGKMCSARLEVRSHFSRSMVLRSVESVPPDTRLKFVPVDTSGIVPLATSLMGFLLFDCSLSHIYLGTRYNSSGNWQWLQTLSLPLHTADLDTTLYSSHQRQFQRSPRRIQLFLELDTTAVHEHLFQAEVHLMWPLLTNWSADGGGLVQFPLTQVGNASHVGIALHNPSSRTVVAQLVLDWAYPRADHVLLAFTSWASGCEGNCSARRFRWASSDAGRAQEQLVVACHKDSLTLILRPDQIAIASLAFSPLTAGQHAATLFIRNNLTILEVLRVSGRAVTPLFKFGNRKPVSGTPLLFELAEKHLKDCARGKTHSSPMPNLTVKRSFTARNYGDLPIHIGGFRVNGLLCEGYGFKILNCEAFTLLPNQTKKVDIAFTPDFTLARVQRTLSIDTSVGSEVNYTLLATLPPSLLAVCSAALGRPSWEPLLYYSVLSLVTFMLFCVLAAAYLEADRVTKSALVAVARDRPMQVLDLNKLACEPDKSAREGAAENYVKAQDVSPVQKPAAKLSPLLPARNRKKSNKKGGEGSEKGWSSVFAASKVRGVEEDATPLLFPSLSQPVTKKSKAPLEAKCSSNCKKSKTSADIQAFSDDEIFSTTTESSNEDDVDKQERLSDRSLKQSIQKDTKDNDKDNYEGDCDDDDYEREVIRRKDLNLRWKPSCKTVVSTASTAPKPIVEPRLVHCEHRTSNLELPYKLKSSKNSGRDRKDKTLLKRRSTDKVTTSKSSSASVENKGITQLRPASCWTEMKASFSDVVARNDSPSYSSVVAPPTPQLADPGLSDCTTTSTLGPIGSKITSSSGTWGNFLESAPHFLQQEPSSSVFVAPFTESLQRTEDQSMADMGRVWEEPVMASDVGGKPDDMSQANLFTDSWPASLWDPLYTPAVVDTVLFPTSDNDTSSSSVWASSVGPVWSSNPWSPASGPSLVSTATTTTNTTTTTAANTLTRNPIDPALGFSPFQSNNIWLPRSTDTAWSPPSKD